MGRGELEGRLGVGSGAGYQEIPFNGSEWKTLLLR